MVWQGARTHGAAGVGRLFPSLGDGFCPWTMETRNAEHRAKPPVSQGQRDELLTLRSPADEEGVYGFFCRRSSERSPEDEPDYASIDDNFSPSLGGSFPRRTWGHRPRFISLREDCAGHRGDATSKNKLFGSGEVLAFDELSQTKRGHVLERGETDPVRLLELLWADLGREHDISDWEKDEDNVFSLPPGEMKTRPSQLLLIRFGAGNQSAWVQLSPSARGRGQDVLAGMRPYFCEEACLARQPLARGGYPPETPECWSVMAEPTAERVGCRSRVTRHRQERVPCTQPAAAPRFAHADQKPWALQHRELKPAGPKRRQSEGCVVRSDLSSCAEPVDLGMIT
ncbi:uncharacterized protein M6G45_008485 [Spheniscus humboldti]